jgi:hypothetical protein
MLVPADLPTAQFECAKQILRYPYVILLDSLAWYEHAIRSRELRRRALFNERLLAKMSNNAARTKHTLPANIQWFGPILIPIVLGLPELAFTDSAAYTQ